MELPNGKPDPVGMEVEPDLDFLDTKAMAGVEVVEFRTSWLGDVKDKFVRLFTRHAKLPDVPSPEERPIVAVDRRPTINEYNNADERCFDRSSWAPLVLTSIFVAAAEIIEPAPGEEPIMGLVPALEGYRKRWTEAGHPLPPDPTNPTGLPLGEEERQYQEQRGTGHGRALGQATGPQAKATSGKPARRAEPGDQQVASDQGANFIRLVDRLTREGKSLSTGQIRQWVQLEGGITSARGDEDIVLFRHGEESHVPTAYLTNYYAGATFEDPDIAGGPFDTLEQYMHYAKAMISSDHDKAWQIRMEASPSKCKRLGRGVNGFDDAAWASCSRTVVERGAWFKFAQNPHLRSYLLGTENALLAEASPTDRRWGIGFSEEEALRSRTGLATP